MCNPPFFASLEEMANNARAKKLPPFAALTGTVTEMVTPGGEVAFIAQIIKESLLLKDRVLWYTSMVGHLSSVPILVEKLREHDVGNPKLP